MNPCQIPLIRFKLKPTVVDHLVFEAFKCYSKLTNEFLLIVNISGFYNKFKRLQGVKYSEMKGLRCVYFIKSNLLFLAIKVYKNIRLREMRLSNYLISKLNYFHKKK